MRFSADQVSFLLDNEPYCLYSGEIHYFRIKKKLWPLHLRKLKEAHCRFVSTYIPWGWHEHDEGKFDFDGRTVPERDLIGFIKLAGKMGLFVTLKPGPYILAEYCHQGLPVWLTKKHPEIRAVNPQGGMIDEFVVTYMHPTFLSYTRKWFERVLAVVRDHQICRGGPVAMLQVENEIGVNQWLYGMGDYSPVALGYFREFLRKKYTDIAQFNAAAGLSCAGFDDLPAPSGIVRTKTDHNLYREWHLFHRDYYCRYLEWVIQEVRQRAITLQLYHNVPGWVYGRARDFPLNITMYDEVFKKHPDIVFGVDHIPENLSYRNAYDDLPCNEILKAMRGGKGPVFAAELQAGSREYSVRTYPAELELFYKASLAHGLFGMNFYMFSQGINPKRKGHFGPTFYWEAALSAEGKEEPLYPVIKDLGAWLRYNEKLLLHTGRFSKIAVGFYAPYYETEFTHPFGGRQLYDAAAVGLKYDTQAVRDQLYFDGVIKAAQMLNYDFDIHDLEKAPVSKLALYTELFVVAVEYMDADTQSKLADYVAGGGTLVLMPTVPVYDLSLKKCEILKDALKIREIESRTPAAPKIHFMGLEDLYAFSRVNVYDDRAGNVIARTFEDNLPCGLQIASGKGQAVVLGSGFTNCIKEHRLAYEKLFNLCGAGRNAYADNEDVRVVERFGTDYAYLFVLNYHRAEQKTKICYKDPATLERREFPREGLLEIPPMTGYILPVSLALPRKAGKIVSSTVEVYNASVKEKDICLTIKGCPHRAAEIVLETDKKPRKIVYNKHKAAFRYAGRTLIVKFKNEEGTGRLSITF
jgi:beta-galactosidase